MDRWEVFAMPFRVLPFLTGLIASAAPAAAFFYERIQRNVHRSPTGPISLLDYVDRAAFFAPHQLAQLGTDYGGWIIPVEAGLTADTVCYCAGAGEDISFECALVEHYPCSVWIIDPTPRALEHFKLLSEAVSAERPFPINNGRENYSIAPRGISAPPLPARRARRSRYKTQVLPSKKSSPRFRISH